MDTPPQPGNTLPIQALELEFPSGGCVGATEDLIPKGPSLTPHPPHRQMQPEGEDSDFDVVFQLQRKEMLQQLLAMLSSAMVLSLQMVPLPHKDSQPRGPTKER